MFGPQSPESVGFAAAPFSTAKNLDSMDMNGEGALPSGWPPRRAPSERPDEAMGEPACDGWVAGAPSVILEPALAARAAAGAPAWVDWVPGVPPAAA